LNRQIERLARTHKAIYSDPGKVLNGSDGKIDESLFTDGLHPNENGYTKLAGQIKRLIK
jgi:lysophospholipase L1-like esterase